MDNFCVEIIIRLPREIVQEKPLKDLSEFLVFETDNKVVFNVPVDWIGFKDGTIISMLKEFGESMYVALAYFSMYNNEDVTDFDGNLLEGYETNKDGKKINKFVKKRLQIFKIIDNTKDMFSVKRYILDLKFTDPVLKVMDIYSDASNGGIVSKEFIK